MSADNLFEDHCFYHNLWQNNEYMVLVYLRIMPVYKKSLLFLNKINFKQKKIFT